MSKKDVNKKEWKPELIPSATGEPFFPLVFRLFRYFFIGVLMFCGALAALFVYREYQLFHNHVHISVPDHGHTIPVPAHAHDIKTMEVLQ